MLQRLLDKGTLNDSTLFLQLSTGRLPSQCAVTGVLQTVGISRGT